jgi:hypothetical protein
MALNCCGACEKPFTMRDFPKDNDNLVFTVCQKFFLHIYHNKSDCLAGWVKRSEKNCPTCRTVVYSHQLGKNIAQISKVFLNSLTVNEETVLEALSTSDHMNGDCIICAESFPQVKIKFNPRNKRLYHATCDSSDLSHLTLHDLSNTVSKAVGKLPTLQKFFTPSPLQRIRTDYPLLFRVAIMSVISLGAFVLNRLQFDGKNVPLNIIGFPAYLTVLATQKVFAQLD